MDRDKLKQIMHNLLSNAFKYLDRGGKVIVSLLSDKEGLILTVEDNGIGISKKDLPHIFEGFYRSDVSRNKATGGTGIGLTITKALVEPHGGKIEAKSEYGMGTVFIIKFPMTIVTHNT